MKRIIFSTFLATATILLIAQGGEETGLGIYESRENLRDLGSTSGTGAVQTFDNRYQGVKGTPFAFETWHEGEIFMRAKKRIKFPNLNYNVFDNIIVYKELESGSIFEVNRSLVDFFILYGSDTMRFEPVQLKENEMPVFGEILHRGENKLFKVYQKEFLKADYEGGYSADRRFDQFVDKASFYAVFPGSGTATKLKTSRRLSKQFPGHNKEMKNYLSDFSNRDLNLKSNMLKVFRYYESLD